MYICQNAAVKEEIDNKGKSGFKFYPIGWMMDYLEHIKKIMVQLKISTHGQYLYSWQSIFEKFSTRI